MEVGEWRGWSAIVGSIAWESSAVIFKACAAYDWEVLFDAWKSFDEASVGDGDEFLFGDVAESKMCIFESLDGSELVPLSGGERTNDSRVNS